MDFNWCKYGDVMFLAMGFICLVLAFQLPGTRAARRKAARDRWYKITNIGKRPRAANKVAKRKATKRRPRRIGKYYFYEDSK